MAFMSAYRGAHALNHHETEMRLFFILAGEDGP